MFFLGLDVRVQKVVVNDLKDDTFYALIWVERNGEHHFHRFAPERRAGPGLARRLPHLRGRRSPEKLEDFQRHLRKIHQRRTPQVARKSSDEDLGRYKM